MPFFLLFTNCLFIVTGNPVHIEQPTPHTASPHAPRLIIGSSIIKLMCGLKATRIQAIPGGHFPHILQWAFSPEGKNVLTFCEYVIILCGGNSISNGMAPHIVFAEAKRTISAMKSLSTPNCKFVLSTLPPRPQIDIN